MSTKRYYAMRHHVAGMVRRRLNLILPFLLFAIIAISWQIAFAQAPLPNPLKPVSAGGNPIFAPVPGADITQNGPAASMHGDPGRGRNLFAQNCTTCHGDRGTDGIPNPGSDDGAVPLLNPIDPGFFDDLSKSPDAAAAFAQEIDLFIQHGSRPSGDDPLYSMIGWGDHKLLTQQQIADVEAYVMQLNGIYRDDRFYPPAAVNMQATTDGKTVTYTLNLVNHGGSPLGDITLQDTLPENLVVVKAAIMGFDERSDPTDPGDQGNNAEVDGTTVKFVGTPNVPVGGSLGPFIIVARILDPRQPVGANVAQLLFSFTTFDGTTSMASAVSDPVTPAAPKSSTSSATVAAASPTSATTATAAATKPAVTATTASTPAAQPTAAPTTAATAPAVTPAATASPAATATPSPKAAASAVQMVEPNPGALSWGFTPQAITVTSGSQVTWTNNGSLQHSATSDDGSFDSGLLNKGDTWSFTFNKAGTYTYHCTPHPWMKATIVVQ